MNWIPDTIDALGRLWQVTGGWGFVALGAVLVFFMFGICVLIIFWRHSNEVVGVAKMLANAHSITGVKILEKLSSIDDSNIAIASQLSKMPSDLITKMKEKPVCIATPPEIVAATAAATAAAIVATKPPIQQPAVHPSTQEGDPHAADTDIAVRPKPGMA